MMLAAQQQRDGTMLVVDLITTDEDKRFAPAGRMATAIIEITQKNGGCLPQDLNERGFTPAEVAEHWHMAQSLAAVEMNLMSERPAKPKFNLTRK
jgi:hypothetical protein